MKARYDGPESMFTYFGPATGKKYVFVGKIPTEIDEQDLGAFKSSGGFTVLEDVILGNIKNDGIKESTPEVKVRKKGIKKEE